MPFRRSDNPHTVVAAPSAVNQHELWMHYFALGGTRSADDLRAYLYGAIAWPAAERAIAAQALHEHRTDPERTEAPRVPSSIN